MQHPRIHDAAIVAMPDERLGERSCAYVVLKAAYGSLTLEEVIAFFGRKRVAKYKYPEHLVVVDSLPRNASARYKNSCYVRILSSVLAKRLNRRLWGKETMFALRNKQNERLWQQGSNLCPVGWRADCSTTELYQS